MKRWRAGRSGSHRCIPPGDTPWVSRCSSRSSRRPHPPDPLSLREVELESKRLILAQTYPCSRLHPGHIAPHLERQVNVSRTETSRTRREWLQMMAAMGAGALVEGLF